MINYGGSLPVSALNIGLAGAPLALQAKVAKLNADIAQLGLALQAQATMSVNFPPNLPGYTTAFAAALNPANLAAALNPANMITVGADASADLSLQLGLITAQLAIVEEFTGTFQLGLNAGSLSGWTYAGSALGFGERLTAQTKDGFKGASPNTPVQALIVATDSFTSWGTFGGGFRTGESSRRDLGATTDQSNLTFQGSLTGRDWNTGLVEYTVPIDLFLAELRGLKSSLEAQIALTLGLNLPDPGPIVELGLSIDLSAALENMVSIQTDLGAAITGLELQIEAILQLVADIDLLLSGGGLSFWFYSGPASGLGAEFAPEIQGGLPGTAGSERQAVYGLVIASADADSWSAFGQIFKAA